ncbi:acylphosphatase [Cellulomonas alba]|uniref:Acylphosphatase n=1 Tax=Cellulomonas alba TaxID=3053467 RepID=A0ABT7SIE2_9CELL|nr:acylphosphatase [Cellulomonas alba]MDM7855930.1 acylphosphatase [Cellulomonas alba]
MTGRRIRVTGDVQGVGFRWACRREAERLGVTGWVRNVADGSVEVSAHGDDAALRALVSWLRSGPPGARVEALTQEDEPGGAPTGFEIRG